MTNAERLLRHFGLEEDPFGVTPDPRYVFFHSHFRPAAAAVYDAIGEGRCFAAIAGPPGTGKTTLANYLMDHLNEATEVVRLDCAFANEEELLYGVMASMGVAPDTSGYFGNWLRLRAHLLERLGQQRRVVLIYDEAHRLSPKFLESVRLFWNLETTREKLVQIILLGQPQLLHMIRGRDLEQLAQRLTVVYEFPPLEEPDVKEYIDHRLRLAGVTKNVFQQDAVHAITKLSRGIPRNVNTLCSQALRLAVQRDRVTVDAKLIAGLGMSMPGLTVLSTTATETDEPRSERELPPHEALWSGRRRKELAAAPAKSNGMIGAPAEANGSEPVGKASTAGAS
jgi:general secretion pathway protein A